MMHNARFTTARRLRRKPDGTGWPVRVVYAVSTGYVPHSRDLSEVPLPPLHI